MRRHLARADNIGIACGTAAAPLADGALRTTTTSRRVVAWQTSFSIGKALHHAFKHVLYVGLVNVAFLPELPALGARAVVARTCARARAFAAFEHPLISGGCSAQPGRSVDGRTDATRWRALAGDGKRFLPFPAGGADK